MVANISEDSETARHYDISHPGDIFPPNLEPNYEDLWTREPVRHFYQTCFHVGEV